MNTLLKVVCAAVLVAGAVFGWVGYATRDRTVDISRHARAARVVSRCYELVKPGYVIHWQDSGRLSLSPHDYGQPGAMVGSGTRFRTIQVLEEHSFEETRTNVQAIMLVPLHFRVDAGLLFRNWTTDGRVVPRPEYIKSCDGS